MKTPESGRICHSYIRFSSKEQAAGDSLRRQREAGTEFAKRHGWVFSNLRFEDQARSGFKSIKREGLELFLSIAENPEDERVQEGHVLMIEAIDRLSRQGIGPTSDLVNRIFKAGLDIAILQPVQKIYRAAGYRSDLGQVVELASFAFAAHAESENKSKRVKEAVKHRRQRHAEGKRDRSALYSQNLPGWIELDAKGKMQAIPAKAKTVREIFKWIADGESIVKVLRRLIDSGVEPITRATLADGSKRTFKREWNATMVRSIVHGRQVLGELNSTTGVVEGYYPPIVPEKLFRAANVELARKRRQSGPQCKRINLFNGLMYSVRDGSTWQAKPSVRGGRWRTVYWRAYTAKCQEKAPGAERITFQIEQFETAFFTFLAELDIEPNRKDPKAALLRDREYVAGEIAELQHQIANKTASAKVLGPPLAKLGEDLEQIDRQLLELGDAQPSTRAVRKSIASMPRKTIAERESLRERVRSIVESIGILPVKVRINGYERVRLYFEVAFRDGSRARGLELINGGVARIDLKPSAPTLREQCEAGWEFNAEKYHKLTAGR